MKITTLLLATAMAFVCHTTHAQGTGTVAGTGIDNPITQAVMKVYADELRQNPQNYNIYFRRANDYYSFDYYDLALADINQALLYTPTSESNLRFREYVLRGMIYDMQKRYSDALADYNSAYSLDPNSYALIYQRANAAYHTGDYASAKADYTRMQRINQRSPEALIGLARVAVKENNLGLANEYLDQAVSIAPNNAELYVRRADVRKAMADHNGAVEDLILAICCDPNHTKAFAGLVEYGKSNYAAVMSGLSNAVVQAPNVGVFPYLRAMIAQAHYKYTAAVSDYQKIIDNNLYDYHGIYASMAECLYALGKYDQALEKINHALAMTGEVPHYFALRSDILRAMGTNDKAVESAAQALAVEPNFNEGLIAMALGYNNLGNGKEAINLLNEAVMNDADNPMPRMLRAWQYKQLGQADAARDNYAQVVGLTLYGADDVRSLRGFAYLFDGNVKKAIAWIENILATTTDPDGMINYYASCLYAQAGDNDKALECAERSLSAGYANYHNWTEAVDGGINTAPLRDELRFLSLLNRYNSIFGRE